MMIAHLTSENLRASFEATMRIQDDMFPNECETVIVTDKPFEWPNCETYVFHDLWKDGQFMISRARNSCMDIALKRDADYLVLIGSDVVVTSVGVQRPETGFGMANIRFQKEGQSVVDAAGHNLRHMCCYVMGRDVLNRFRFSEEFVGYGSRS